MSDCVPWTGRLNTDGYGTLGSHLAHRRLWEDVHGPVPDGLELDHRCGRRDCVNLDHLEAVTHAENVARGNAGRPQAERTHCPRGHPYSGDNLLVSSGSRLCRACRREQERARRAEQRSPDDPCSRCGEPFDSVASNGRRYCSSCTAANGRRAVMKRWHGVEEA